MPNKSLFLLLLIYPVFGSAAFDIQRPSFLTENDVKKAYFYNSKSRAPDFAQEYWLCSESKKTKIINISCSPLNDDEVDGTKRGFLFINLTINNKKHFIIPRNGSSRRDCICQAKATKRIVSAPTFCFLVQDQNINSRHFFQKETNWTFEKVKSDNGEVSWGQLCEEGLEAKATSSSTPPPSESSETNQ